MFRRSLCIVPLLLLASVSFAQDQDEGQRRFRGGPPDGRGPGGPPPWSGRMMDRMIDRLDLDEEQEAAFREIMGPVREQMQSMGDRWREVAEARDAGDEAKADELRRNLMREMESTGPDAMNAALTQLEPMLRPEQVEKLDEMVDRMDRDRESRDRYRQIRDELPDKLNLDEQQRGQFDEMATAARERVGENFRNMRPLFEQMREAQESGDEARVAEIRKQMDAQRPDMDAVYAEFLTQVEGILNPEQKTALADFRGELGLDIGGAAPADNSKAMDPREVLRLVKRLRLNDEQRDKFKEIEREVMSAYREARRDADKKAQLSEKLTDDVLAILDDAQKQRFESLLDRAQKRAQRG